MTKKKTSASSLYLGIDVGGTNIKVGIVGDDGIPIAFASRPTDAQDSIDAGLDNMEKAVEDVLKQHNFSINEIQGIGLATPGTMDLATGWILEPPNLPTWRQTPIRDLVADRFNKQTILQNDANAAAYGEYWAGAARDSNILVFWTLGTGIGGGVIVNGEIMEGAHSHGAESGHVIIEMDNGRLCGTGQYGTLEAYAGGWALTKRCQEGIDAGEKTSLTERLKQGTELTPLLITQEAEQGDSYSLNLILESARYLGIGTTTLMHIIDPDMVLLGGAMTFGRNENPIGRQFLKRLKEEVNQRAFPTLSEKTIIDYASLGSDAGFIGAAGCACKAFPTK